MNPVGVLSIPGVMTPKGSNITAPGFTRGNRRRTPIHTRTPTGCNTMAIDVEPPWGSFVGGGLVILSQGKTLGLYVEPLWGSSDRTPKGSYISTPGSTRGLRSLPTHKNTGPQRGPTSKPRVSPGVTVVAPTSTPAPPSAGQHPIPYFYPAMIENHFAGPYSPVTGMSPTPPK